MYKHSYIEKLAIDLAERFQTSDSYALKISQDIFDDWLWDEIDRDATACARRNDPSELGWG